MLKAAIWRHRFGPVLLVACLVITLSLITRIILFVQSWPSLELSALRIAGIFLIGLFYDIVVASFFAIPVAFYCWLMKDSWYRKKWSRVFLYFIFIIITIILVVNACSEIVFWGEFNVRFNFIAVDYLIYTTEVLGNIQESYNMPLIFGGLAVAVLLLFLAYRKMLIASQQSVLRFGRRSLYFLGIMLLAAAGYFLVNNTWKNFSSNNYVNELAGNGTYEFGAAFWHNEIDYNRFYAERDQKQNFAIVRNLLAQSNASFSSDPLSIERAIHNDSAEHKWNVVLISVESLSGEYLKHFGNTGNITPYLDSLIPHSLFFEHFYASGTRTVRGLEALSLAIPPTPGQSIVRRPGNEDMFTMGNVLKDKGYDVRYVYGGNSFFDNMGYFFSHNGYQVIDQRDIPKDRIHHTTAWGVADEDAFSILMDECDESYKNGKLFFNHLMTVSNHRPYTYPEGRIDIPGNAHSREGAIKYTDYAINAFIRGARLKPWFNNTLFVVVADHCARSAGKTDLPVNMYHIPCLIYAPQLVPPSIEQRFTSQIDLAPTVLGMMNLNYTSRFMGYDIYKSPSTNARFFISTYQDMGYVKSDTLVILSPVRKVASFKINFSTGAAIAVKASAELVNEAIANYQTASYLFTTKSYKK